MAVNNSAFSNLIPSGNSSIRHGDDQIRSDKSLFQAVINDEHYMALDSASSASGGIHKPGSARIYAPVARASLGTPASADSAYRLAATTDLESLHLYGASSASTVVYGKQPYGSRYSRVLSALASGSYSTVTFALVDYDIGSMASNTTSVFNLTSAGSGRYILTANIQFAESVRTGTHRAVRICKNGASIGGQSASTSTSAGNTIELSCSVLDHSFATTDFYSCHVYHDAGVSLTSLSVAGYFAINRL